jgi:3-deoxy-manno-octulosonate cytidylyltransferase (CMP-KDO synthetase)
MATLAVIPARLGATRLPNKPLRLLGGQPLILRVWQRVHALGAADLCVIATDSPQVASVAEAAGAPCVLTDPDHPSGTDRVAEVVALQRYREFTTIVNVQGDEPFITGEAIHGAAIHVQSGRFPLGTVALAGGAEALEDPNVVKVVCADDGRALYFSRAGIPYTRDSRSDDRLVRRHVGVYAYSRDALAAWVALPVHELEAAEKLEQLRPLAAGIAMGVTTLDSAWHGGVDTESDLVRANEFWEAFSSGVH